MVDFGGTPDSDVAFSADPAEQPTLIGYQTGNPALSFAGTIDEIWIYRRALGDDEILALHRVNPGG